MPPIEIEYLDFIPIILAIFGIVFTTIRMNSLRYATDIIIACLSIVGCMLLIVAQTSWWDAAVIQGKLDDVWFANQIWLIFNSIMMVIIIITNYPRRGNP
jgi:hypothetical protein